MPAFMVFTRERMRDEKEYEIYKQKNHEARARQCTPGQGEIHALNRENRPLSLPDRK
jgi:hypothetical protein